MTVPKLIRFLAALGVASGAITASVGCGDCEATVSKDDPLYDRFEGTGFDNACSGDGECVVGGCGGEVCAAESVATTCELLDHEPSGECVCVQDTCI